MLFSKLCSEQVFLRWLAVHWSPSAVVQIRQHPVQPVEHLIKQHLKCLK